MRSWRVLELVLELCHVAGREAVALRVSRPTLCTSRHTTGECVRRECRLCVKKVMAPQPVSSALLQYTERRLVTRDLAESLYCVTHRMEGGWGTVRRSSNSLSRNAVLIQAR